MTKRNARRFKKVKKVKIPSNTMSIPPRSVNVDLNVVDVPDTDAAVSDDEPMEAVHVIEAPANSVETSITVKKVMEADIEGNKDGIDEKKEEVIIAFEEDNVNGDVVDISEVEKEAEVELGEKTNVNDEDDGFDVKNIIEKKESPKKVKARKKIQSCFATKFWKGRNYSALSLKQIKSDDLNLIKRADKNISEMILPSTFSTSEPALQGVEHSNIKLPISVETTGDSGGFHQEISLEHEHSCVKSDDSIYDPYQFLNAYFPIPNIRLYVTNYDEETVGTETVENGNNTEEGYANSAEVGIGSGGMFKELNITLDSKSTHNPLFATDIVHDGPLSSLKMEPKEDENWESVFKDVATDLDSPIYDPYTPLLTVSKSNQYHYKKSGIQLEQFSDSESVIGLTWYSRRLGNVYSSRDEKIIHRQAILFIMKRSWLLVLSRWAYWAWWLIVDSSSLLVLLDAMFD